MKNRGIHVKVFKVTRECSSPTALKLVGLLRPQVRFTTLALCLR